MDAITTNVGTQVSGAVYQEVLPVLQEKWMIEDRECSVSLSLQDSAGSD